MRIDQPSSVEELALDASGFRFAIVASRWNDSIVARLIEGAREALRRSNAAEDSIEIFRVPGSFELPLCALKAAKSGRFEAVICLGVIIRGDTPHFDYVAAATARGISLAGLQTGVPVMFGVITADSVDQALARSGDDTNNKGFESARAAIEVAKLYRDSFGSGA